MRSLVVRTNHVNFSTYGDGYKMMGIFISIIIFIILNKGTTCKHKACQIELLYH